MADGTIGIDEPSTIDKKLDTTQLTVGVNTVQRERVVIAGAAAADLAPVDATAGLKVNLGADNDVTVTGTVTVDGSGVTQPVSAASLPLPTGAATAAKQPALGTAGTASSDVITVQGIASMTALKVDGSGVTQPVSASSLPLPTGAATSANQSTGNTALAAIQTAVEGTLTVDGSGVTQPISHAALTELAAAISTEVQCDIVGALPAGTNNIGDVDIASIAAGDNNIGNVDVVTLPSLPAGTNNIGDVDLASAIPAGTNTIGAVKGAGPNGTPWTSVHQPAANTQATTTKAAAGAGVTNVCTGITVTLAAGSTAPSAVQLSVVLRDGASGAGTVKWAGVLSLPATAGASVGITRSGLWIEGTANTAMTLEFSAAGGANTVEAVSLEGTTA